MAEENWRPIAGYEGLYSVSDRGRVMFHRRRISRQGRRPYWSAGGLMSQRKGNDYGHWCVTLYDRDGVPKKRYVHQLVAETFIPRVPEKNWVLHGPKGPGCNFVTNLRWGNQSDNEKDKYLIDRPRLQGKDSSGALG